MNRIAHIRKEILAMSQKDFAEAVGTTQATVSRWESGELSPDLEQIKTMRRLANEKLAGEKKARLPDSFFFEDAA